MKDTLKHILATAVLVLGFATPAWAQMPQTDVEFLKLVADKPAQQQLDALVLYYSMHNAEITTQLKNEVNTGAFFARARVQSGGDAAKIERATARAQETLKVLKAARTELQDIRRRLGELTGVDFVEDVAIQPDAPDELPALAPGAPADLAAARAAAFDRVTEARAKWRDMRFQLLEDQDRYDEKRDVRIGDSMRDMTRAEIELIGAVTHYRMIEAKIAAALGQPIAEALSGL